MLGVGLDVLPLVRSPPPVNEEADSCWGSWMWTHPHVFGPRSTYASIEPREPSSLGFQPPLIAESLPNHHCFSKDFTLQNQVNNYSNDLGRLGIR